MGNIMMNNFSASIYSEDGSIFDSLESDKIGEVIDFVWDKLQQGYSAVVKNLGVSPAEEIELGPEYSDDQDRFEEDMLRFSRIGQGGEDWDWDEQYADSYYESLDDDYDEDDYDDDYYEDEDKYSLVGVDGNAYSIMGYTANALKREGLRDLVDQMHAEATSGDYDNLISVCFKYVEMANEAARGDYDDIQESLKNTKINIRESLNKIDLRTSNKYDLRNLYDSCILNDKEKRTIAEMIAKNTKANVLYEALMNKFEGKELKESDDQSEKIVIFKELGKFRATPESNYNSRIRNERKVQKLDDFDSADDIMNYYIKYGWADSKDDFKVIDESLKESKSLKYDKKDAEKYKGKFDVASPQETANFFRKRVKSGNKEYSPNNKPIKEAIDLEKIVNTSAPRFSWRDKYEKFKEDALQYDYCVVKSNRWYDPEGLDIPSNAEIVFAGTKQECLEKLDQIVAARCNKQGRREPVVEDRGDDYVTIYYPGAIGKATFKVVSTPN